jgi:hypothetical protein
VCKHGLQSEIDVMIRGVESLMKGDIGSPPLSDRAKDSDRCFRQFSSAVVTTPDKAGVLQIDGGARVVPADPVHTFRVYVESELSSRLQRIPDLRTGRAELCPSRTQVSPAKVETEESCPGMIVPAAIKPGEFLVISRSASDVLHETPLNKVYQNPE